MSFFALNRNSFSINMILDNEDDVVEELKEFKQFGGSTLCELTVNGIRIESEMNRLKLLSQSTGVNIICGTGFYVDKCLTDEQKNMTRDDLAKVMIDEIVTGIPGTDGIRCGIIGEIGCSWPLTINERRVLQAAAQTQQQTGQNIIIQHNYALMHNS